MAKQRGRVHFLPKALDDIDEMITFISSESTSRSLSYFNKIEEKILRHEDFPLMGHMPKDERIKKLGYRQFSVEEYEVFYRIENDLILICRVIHSSRDYQKLMTN